MASKQNTPKGSSKSITKVEHFTLPYPHVLRVTDAEGNVSFEFSRSAFKSGERAAALGTEVIVRDWQDGLFQK